MESQQPELQRKGSSVPVSTHSCESTVVPIPIDKCWNIFKTFKLDKVMPGSFKSSNFTKGGPNQLDSVLKLEYTDGAVWELRINEISDTKHSLGYQVLSTEPAHSATSI